MRQFIIWSFIVFIILFSGGIPEKVSKASEKPYLLVYCGAGFKSPMEVIAKEFNNKYGIKLRFQFNGAGTLLSQIKLSKTGDIFIPGDYEYVDKLKNVDGKNYIDDDSLILYHIPVLITPKKTNIEIKNIFDLQKDGVKVVLGSESISIGKLTKKILNKAGIYDKVYSNVISEMGTVNQVAMAVSLGEADAGIVWYTNYKEIDDKVNLIELPTEINIVKKVSISVLNFSKNKNEAFKFKEFMLSRGKEIFKEYGYEVANGK
ncbi:MAG: molybdate ABC transporter substrate-binding protein [Halanaerobiales bacterium]|nr:molybdate ABC transporter substrate-binding protein [Halanaerobiales bacterium]